MFRFGSSRVISISDGSTILLAGSKIRGLFKEVDGAGRPSQRLDRFEGGVAVGVCAATIEAGLGRYTRSRIRRAKWLVSAMRPATFAETLRKASDGDILIFF